MLPFFQFLNTGVDHSQWGRLVNTSQIPIPFDHASSYFLEEFKSQMAGHRYHQDSYENAMLLSIECIASWSHPGVVQTNSAYLDLSCSSIPKRLRKYFSDFLRCPAVNRNMKVYYLLHLGILILKRLSVETKESQLLLVFDKICDQLNYNLTPAEVVQYDSTTNILWNSVVMAKAF